MRSGGISRDMGLLPGRRQERAFERLYRSHVADVYRYALVVLRDPGDAESATRATFASAHRTLERGALPDEASTWLLRTAHDACRWRSVHDQLPEDDAVEDARGADGPFNCERAEWAISQELDARLAPPEERLLRAHLRACLKCVRFAEAQRSHRAALRSFKRVPLPETLQAPDHTARTRVAIRGAAITATALVAAGVIAGSVSPGQLGNDATRVQPAGAAPERATLFIPPRLPGVAAERGANGP
jgi:DNA-directed RNA polymerase specialized sigma24 family protein